MSVSFVKGNVKKSQERNNYYPKRECTMPKGYIIAHPNLTNTEKFVSDYGSKVGDVVEQYDGHFLVRGGDVSYREGDSTDLNVVVEFPSLEKAMECKNSPEYKAIEAGRKDNMTGMFIVIEGV